MPLDNLSYLAGLVDGEGCVGFHSCGKGKTRFVIQIKMTSEEVIDWLQKTYGGYKTFRPRQKPHWKDQWRWRVQYGTARDLYERLRPLLKIKVI